MYLYIYWTWADKKYTDLQEYIKQSNIQGECRTLWGEREQAMHCSIELWEWAVEVYKSYCKYITKSTDGYLLLLHLMIDYFDLLLGFKLV